MVIFRASGADHRSVLVYGQIFAVFQAVWDFIAATSPQYASSFGGIFTAPGILLWAYGERLSGGSVAYGAVYSRCLAVAAGWFGGVFRML